MPFDLAEARRIRAERRQEAEVFQLNQQAVRPRGYAQPAIGKTGGADNVGWEVHIKGEPVRYYATKE